MLTGALIFSGSAYEFSESESVSSTKGIVSIAGMSVGLFLIFCSLVLIYKSINSKNSIYSNTEYSLLSSGRYYNQRRFFNSIEEIQDDLEINNQKYLTYNK